MTAYNEGYRCHWCGEQYASREYGPACSREHRDKLRNEVGDEPYNPSINRARNMEYRAKDTAIDSARELAKEFAKGNETSYQADNEFNILTVDDLKQMRLKALLTQETLGIKLKVNASAISHYESRERKISLAMAIKWAEACNGVFIKSKSENQIKLWATFVNHQYSAWSALFELITGFKPPRLKDLLPKLSGH